MTSQRILELKPEAVETIRNWVMSCTNEDQAEVCRLFIQDTIYTRYGDSDMDEYLQYLVIEKLRGLKQQLEEVDT
ncbi:MAG: hypothetical protein EPN37_07065 [Chitinophagaceae bacterium]|nr:MAG: hypothetical protein EPN37_07065 [Chitinophagaceae bacterium]